MQDGRNPNELLAAVARGDRAAFAVLFDHFAPRVATYLARSGAVPATAEELAQEAMIQVWRKAASFDPARGAASTWVFTIARNLRIDRWRASSEDEFALDSQLDAVDDGPSPEEQVSRHELQGRLQRALGALSAEHATLVRLCYFSERATNEVARDLSIPLGTVKSRIRVALLRLRSLLAADGP